MPVTTTITTESELAAWVSARNAQTGTWADEQWGEIDSPGVNITSTITLNPGGSGPGAVLRPFSSRSIASSIRAIYGTRATLYARDFSGLVLQGSRAVVDGLQLSRSNADGGSYSVQNGAVIRNSILDQGASNNVLVSSGGTGGFIDNCLLIGKTGGSWLADGTGALWLRNCVLWANGAASGVRSNFGDAGAINCVFVGFTTDVSGTAISGTTNNSTTNAAWGGTGWGTNGQTSISAAANFVNVGAGSEDFTTIDTTPSLRDTGATVAGLTTDLFGNTRPRGPSYDRGLTELAAAGGPTITTQPQATTVNEPAAAAFSVSATASGGSLTYQWQRANPGSGTFSPVSGATSATINVTPTSAAADNGAQYRCNVTDSNGTTTSSAPTLTVRSTTTTARPSGDVSSGGWTPSSGAVLWDMLDETSPSDTDYITSPSITATPVPAVMALPYPLASGTWNVGIRARCTSASATMRVKLLDGTGAVVGTSADQAITNTFATFTLPITISAPALRASVEVVS